MTDYAGVPPRLHEILTRLDQIAIDLGNLQYEYGDISNTILDTRDKTWFGMDPGLTVAERDRVASHNVAQFEMQLTATQAAINALVTERDHLILKFQYLKDLPHG